MKDLKGSPLDLRPRPKISFLQSLIMSTETEKAGAPPDDVGLTSIPANESHEFKELTVSKSGVMGNLKICPAGSQTATFFIDVSFYTPSKADITLHSGSDSRGKVVGVVDLKKFAGHYEVAIGDLSGKEELVWEPLEVVQYWASRHGFEAEFGDQGVKEFIWRHPGERLSDHPGDMELVKEENPDYVLAQYVKAGTHSWKSRGNLLIREGYGEEWELMVILTALALVVVKSRR